MPNPSPHLLREDAYLKGRGAQINTPNRFLKNQTSKRTYRSYRRLDREKQCHRLFRRQSQEHCK
jgi:hypothetical protein